MKAHQTNQSFDAQYNAQADESAKAGAKIGPIWIVPSNFPPIAAIQSKQTQLPDLKILQDADAQVQKLAKQGKHRNWEIWKDSKGLVLVKKEGDNNAV